MRWLLSPGSTHRFADLPEPVTILRGLGGGSQGQVFAVRLGGEELALKWYLPGFLARDRGLEGRLQESIRRGSPGAAFLWPLALLRPEAPLAGVGRSAGTGGAEGRGQGLSTAGWGYLMPLRPPSYRGAVDHAAGRLTISLANVLRCAFQLASGFHDLHSLGLCYKDVSLGNVFLDPERGRILIGDNDNVAVSGDGSGAVIGTWGFMAPEVALGQARPSASSDLFALAALLFQLLTRHDPFKGALELAIPCLDLPHRRRLYAEDPVFIFDPRDGRNRPDPIEHGAALLTWPIYPRTLQQLFERTFGPGLRDPVQRTLTGEWRQVLAACLDQRRLCPACGEENFVEPRASGLCWACAAPLPPPPRLLAPAGVVSVAAGNELHRHHLDPLAAEAIDQPLARVEAHPNRPALLGLRNLSTHPWTLTLAGGETITVAPGETAGLARSRELRSAAGQIRIEP